MKNQKIKNMDKQLIENFVERILRNTRDMTVNNLEKLAVEVFTDCALLFDARKSIENLPVRHGWDTARIHFLFGLSMLGRSEKAEWTGYRKLTPCRSFKRGEVIDSECIFIDTMNMTLKKACRKKKTREEFFEKLSSYLKVFEKLLDTRWIKEM